MSAGLRLVPPAPAAVPAPLAAALLSLLATLSLAACRDRADPAERRRPTQSGELTQAAADKVESATPRRVDPDVPATAVDEGHALVGRLKKELVTALTSALAEGPASAISVCNHDAPLIAARLGSGTARIGRATDRPRNPANLATGWRADALDFFRAAAARGRPLDGAVYAITLPDATAYAEPLTIAPLCLTCHGTNLAPEVTTTLASLYPKDLATGYAAGDLRGIVWVELPRAP